MLECLPIREVQMKIMKINEDDHKPFFTGHGYLFDRHCPWVPLQLAIIKADPSIAHNQNRRFIINIFKQAKNSCYAFYSFLSQVLVYNVFVAQTLPLEVMESNF